MPPSPKAPSKRAPHSRKPAVVRARILDAAQTEFMAHGFAAASTNRILERFGGSKPTMFRHYPTKRALFAGVVARIAEGWREAIPADTIDRTDPQSWLVACATMALQWILTPENLFVGRMAIAEGQAFPEVAEVYRNSAVVPLEALFAERLRGWTSAGLLACPDPERDARALLDLTLSGQVSRALYGVDEPEIAALGAHAAYCVELFLRGRIRRQSASVSD